MARLTAAKGFSVTFDAWSDQSKLGWLALTGQYYMDHRACNSILGIRPLPARHTAEAIQSCVEEILADFALKPSDVIQAVTDNASVMTKACKLLNIPRSPCIAHLLQLIVARVFAKSKTITEEDNIDKSATMTEELDTDETDEIISEDNPGAIFFEAGSLILQAAGKIANTIRNSTRLTAQYLTAFAGTDKVCFLFAPLSQ